MVSRMDAVAKYAAKAVDHYGRNAVVQASRDITRKPKRGRSQSVAFDYCHGGGLLFGALHLFVGAEHSGKTTEILHTIADLHRRCANCLEIAGRVVYGPKDVATPVEQLKLAPGSVWSFDGREPFMALRHKVSKAPARIVSIRWRTKTKRNAMICLGQGEDADGVARTGGHAPVFIEIPIDEPEKCEYELCRDHGVVFDVPYCDCVFNPDEHIPYQVNQDTGKPESDGEYDDRLSTLRLASNSYDATLAKFFDLEDKLSLEWAADCGVDTTRLFLGGAAHGEDIVDQVSTAVACGLFAAIAIDSIEFIEPKSAVEGSAHDNEDRGRGAKLANRGFREWVVGSADTRRKLGRKPTFLVANQLRKDSQGEWVLPKGYGQKYAATTIFKFWTSAEDREAVEVSGLKSKKSADGDPKPSNGAITTIASTRVNFIAEKQGAGAKVRGSAELRNQPVKWRDVVITPRGQFFDHDYVFKVAQTQGIVASTPEGLATNVPGYEEDRHGTLRDIKQKMITEPAFFNAMRDTVLKSMLAMQEFGTETWGG
jgi:RecA/RadA recombinase